MADSDKKSSSGADELLAKIGRIEADLQEIEKARKQQTLIVRVGMLLILLAVLLFAWNLYNFSKNMMKQENFEVMSQKFMENMQDMLNNDPEVKKIQDSIVKQVIPELTKEMVNRFKQDLPSFKKKGEKVFQNLQIYLESYMKDELEKALVESIAELEKDLNVSYPKVSPEKLHQIIKSSEVVFIEHITTALENRVRLVYDELDKIEKTFNKFQSLDDVKQLDKMEMHDIKLALIESVLELGIYEINPEKGNKPANSVQGGAK